MIFAILKLLYNKKGAVAIQRPFLLEFYCMMSRFASSAIPCPYPTPYPFHLPVGAGHARPATSRLPPLNPPFVGRGLDPSAAPCPCRCFIFHSVGAAYMPPAPPLSKGGGRACEAGGIPAALPFCLPYPFTSFTSFSPLANARAFSIVVMAMLCNAVRVKNA